MVTEKRRLLVVDDDPDQRLMISQLLERGGFAVTTAEGANDALKILSRAKMDLIVSDINMPSIKGTDFANYLSAIKESSKRVLPIVLITASTQNISQEVKESGASGFCFKGEIFKKLLPMIHEILGAL